MAVSHSDALVLFGVTGDLAHKMIFPALYAMDAGLSTAFLQLVMLAYNLNCWWMLFNREEEAKVETLELQRSLC